MTLDLSNTTVTLYLQGSRPTGELTVSLKSKYNNKYLTDGEDTRLLVSVVDYKLNWWKGSFTFSITDYTGKDIAGYYDFELYEDASLILTKLTKVVNSWKGSQNTYHVGDNENNEQYILYK